MKYLATFFIILYQKTLSFDHGLLGRIFPKYRICMFYPSCSEYSRQSYLKYGFFKGTFLSVKRVIKCSPLSWNKPKWDPS